jgi:GH24 family phage-related lysozyme (muramidase)
LKNVITARALHTIKSWERFRAMAYKDGVRKDGTPILSIGFGHSNQLETPSFDETSVWTQEYASEVLLQDLEYFGKLLRPHLKIEVPDALWGVLMSLAFNKGVGAPGKEKGLINSEAWRILHDTSDKYHKELFCEAILKYAVHAPNKDTGVMEEKKGLRWRRIAEAAIYLQDRSENYL